MKIIDINGNEKECAAAYPDKGYPGFIKLEIKTPVRSYIEWMPIEDFKRLNPNLSDIVKGLEKPADDAIGVVTSSQDNSLTDKIQNWKKNAYATYPIWIARGKGESQIRKIVSNSKNKVIIDKPWNLKPNNFSQYVISRNIHKMKAMGNMLPAELIHRDELKAKKMDRDREKAEKIAQEDASKN